MEGSLDETYRGIAKDVLTCVADSASDMFANNAIDTFDALLRKNIYGFKRRIFNINIHLIRVMYNCFEIVNGPIGISWANSLCTVKL